MCILLNFVSVTGFVLDSAVKLENNPLAIRRESINWGFILFFVCFFILSIIISNRNKFLFSMFNRLFRNKERQSMFYENVTNETLKKLILSLQTILVVSIIFYCYVVHEQFMSITSLTQMLILLGVSSLVLIVFLLYKFLAYFVAGAIFFKKETYLQWNDDFFSIISLNGIFLFFPALILFYVDSAFYFCIYFIIIYLIFNLFFIFYKIKTLFFQGNSHLLYFILYLCTQEIIPLYLVYRGFVYLIAQKDAIWIQV